ncbi:MAG: ATP-dependent Clp protease adaptor protein ClpS [Sulfurospirillum sp.]|jgi:ATP-dependent Clp protease adaptor protein ClpS|nr:ATP-dependent Clp protease adaptor protein ClpS [Sulfurospirillum sp.]DAB32881.1 MAG TPA: ATP-dependent Clp protease adapter ClpS [Sulfurospirillum sp. UBA11407]DAB33531.1 MAG TPA: ATP-dependent Clp protease adapter ClpS [Sulfurospirillum sp. UBA12182]
MPKIEYEIEESIILKTPKMYRVLLLNDDYTSMEFVIQVLMVIFHKNEQEAYEIMMKVHKEGKGLCGIYTYEIAETKAMQVKALAKQNNFPLKAIVEEE